MKDLLDQSTVRNATQTGQFTHDVPMIGHTNPTIPKNVIEIAIPQIKMSQHRRPPQPHVVQAPTIRKGRGGVSLINKNSLLSKAIKQPTAAVTNPAAAVSMVGKTAKVIQIGNPTLGKTQKTVPVKLGVNGATGSLSSGANQQPTKLIVRQQGGAGQLGQGGTGKSIIILSSQKPTVLPGVKTQLGQPQVTQFKIQSVAQPKSLTVVPVLNTLSEAAAAAKVAGQGIVHSSTNTSVVNTADQVAVKLSDSKQPTSKVADPTVSHIITSTVQTEAASSHTNTTVIASTNHPSLQLQPSSEKVEDVLWVDTNNVISDVSVETEVVTSQSSVVETGEIIPPEKLNIPPLETDMTSCSEEVVVSAACDDFNCGEEVVFDSNLPDVSENVEVGGAEVTCGEESTQNPEDTGVSLPQNAEQVVIKQEPMDTGGLFKFDLIAGDGQLK